jgi:outer membrane protein assembly factor BamB
MPYHAPVNIPIALVLLLAATWPQFGRDATHAGNTTVPGQPFRTVLAAVTMDPFVETERELFGDDLLVHYAAPVIDGDDVFVEVKAGTYTPNNWSTQTWGVQAYRWEGSKLVARWTTMSDWKPVPFTGGGIGPTLEPVFQPVLANGFIYMPGLAGHLIRLNRDTGAILDFPGAITPSVDFLSFVSGPLVVDSSGSIYYNRIFLTTANSPWTTDIRGAALMRIGPNGAVTMADYANIVSGAPAATAQCLGAFDDSQLPWPPSPNVLPPSVTCGSQRPGINIAPAVAPDGTVYTVSRAHFNSRWSYLVALNADMTPKWSASLRDRFNDGCNVLLPASGTPGGCRAGALQGVDPSDNTPGAGRAFDDSSSSPLIAPDGSVLFAAYTRYNYSQGHLMHFSARGDYLGAYPFGWDITPAVHPHDSTYSIVTKENHYNVGSYCDSSSSCPAVRRANDPLGFFVTRLSASLSVEYQLPNPNEQEWCVNGPAIDRDGVAYMNAEDGSLYSINANGSLRQSIVLTPVVGQAYTPLAIDDRGRVYAEKAGILFVVGTPLRQRSVKK